MPFEFQKIQLYADSLLSLINTWAEMQLIVEEDSFSIIGYGYTDEIAEAFTILVFDWEATISLQETPPDIPPGSYDLVGDEGIIFACKDQKCFPIKDQAVIVEVLSVPEE
jgi:hypothetical protein